MTQSNRMKFRVHEVLIRLVSIVFTKSRSDEYLFYEFPCSFDQIRFTLFYDRLAQFYEFQLISLDSLSSVQSNVLSVSSRQQLQQLLRSYPTNRLTCANSEKFGQRGKVSSPKFSPNWHRWACSRAIAKLLISTPF